MTLLIPAAAYGIAVAHRAGNKSGVDIVDGVVRLCAMNMILGEEEREDLDEIPDLMKVAAHVGQVVRLGDSGIPYLRFAPDAQELFDAWRAGLERRLRSKELAATPAFEAHIAKYRSLMPSLALIFHLLDLGARKAPSPVSKESASLAADWCEFLEVHARKVYSAELSPGMEAVPLLAAKIRAGSIGDRQAVREIARHQWAGLSDATTVRAGLKTLEAIGWVRLFEEETGGRPTEIVRLHPSLRRAGDA